MLKQQWSRSWRVSLSSACSSGRNPLFLLAPKLRWGRLLGTGVGSPTNITSKSVVNFFFLNSWSLFGCLHFFGRLGRDGKVGETNQGKGVKAGEEGPVDMFSGDFPVAFPWAPSCCRAFNSLSFSLCSGPLFLFSDASSFILLLFSIETLVRWEGQGEGRKT